MRGTAPGSVEGVKQRPLAVALVAVGVVALAVTIGLLLPRAVTPPPPIDSEGLRDAVTADALKGHLDALQQAADANGGNRAAGTPGFAASADYVAGRLEAAGYQVQRQQFSYDRPDYSQATLQQRSPTVRAYTVLRDFQPLTFSGTGTVTAAVTAVDLNLAGDRRNTSGCEAGDFAGFPRGSIALVQRGTCAFGVKAGNAVAAGASAVIVLNQGDDPSRRGLFAGTLGRQAAVPVLATSYERGAEWAGNPGTTLALSVAATTTRVSTENLIADTATGSPERTIVVGAHLDGVEAGPGINDNASGTAAVLETAIQFAELGIQPAARVRFAFWSGEEDGLYGSRHYVGQLGEDGRRTTALYLNLDMIGSPNPVPAVYAATGRPTGSEALQAVLTEFLTAQGITPQTVDFDASDHAPFLAAGIAAGGLFTGADDGADPCYHQACDRVDTVDLAMLEVMADAAAHATLSFAQAEG